MSSLLNNCEVCATDGVDPARYVRAINNWFELAVRLDLVTLRSKKSRALLLLHYNGGLIDERSATYLLRIYENVRVPGDRTESNYDIVEWGWAQLLHEMLVGRDPYSRDVVDWLVNSSFTPSRGTREALNIHTEIMLRS